MPKRTHLVLALAATAVLIISIVVWFKSREPLPPEIRIAAGKKDGLYDQLAHDFAERLHQRTGRPVRVIETAGTEANVALLRDGGAELALIQAVSSTPEGVAGIAPLFPEPLHFIVRKGQKIQAPKDLVGKRVALGLSGSSMRGTSTTVLAHYDVPLTKVKDGQEHFDALGLDPKVDAALVTTGWMNPILVNLLRSGDFELIAIDDPDGLAMRHPWFTTLTIPQGLYPGKTPMPPRPVRTVAVTALLAGRSGASDRLVREALAVLYETDLRSSYPAVLSAKAAKDYDASVMHPSVAKYHDPSAGFTALSQALEFISKSKEALFGVIAFALMVWGWLLRWREKVAAAADLAQRQKLADLEKVAVAADLAQRQKLDDLIGRTLTVELEQMDVTDPELLRPFLRRVTQIKQEALRELTSEKVRGDQLFAIFLSQCAALSEKIQMRMLYGRMSETVEQEVTATSPAP